MSLHSRILKPQDQNLIDQFLQLFHASFSPSTRETDEQIWQELNRRFRLPMRVVAITDEGSLLAFARYSFLSATRVLWLVHIAVQPRQRSRGVGSRLLRSLVEEAAPLPVLAEVEEGSRAMGWYEREGFRTICSGYVQPALHASTGPVPLLLMASQPVERVQDTVRNFYREAWMKAENDPIVVNAKKRIDA